MGCRPIKKKDDLRPTYLKSESFKTYFGTRSIEWDRGIRFMYDNGFVLVKHNHFPVEQQTEKCVYIDYDVYMKFEKHIDVEKNIGAIEVIEGYGYTDQEALMDVMILYAKKYHYRKRVNRSM